MSYILGDSFNVLLSVPVALLLCAGGYNYLTKPRHWDDVPEPPIPSRIWGHLLQVHGSTAGVHWGQWMDTYGTTIKIKPSFGTERILVSADPGLIHRVLTTNSYNYSKSEFMRPFVQRVIGEGLVWAEGDMHKTQRKQLVSAFSQEAVNKMIPAVSDVAARTAQKILSFIEKGDDVLDVHDIVSKTTFDVFGYVAFNHDFRSFDKDSDSAEVREKWTQQQNDFISFGGFLGQYFLRKFPWIGSLPLPAIQAQGTVRVAVKSIADEIISRANEGSSITGNDFLSMLLRNKELTGPALIDNISTFIIAGFDTTSAAITWALYSFAKWPETQDKLRAELLALGRELNIKDVSNMDELPYFSAVCKEILRMYPASDPERVALEDDVLPLRFPIITPSGKTVDKIPIKKGDTLIISPICSNRLKSVWGDGDVWRPERWLEPLPSKDLLTQGWSNLISFGEGPRNCIGWRLALVELKVIISVMVRNFVFTLPSDDFEVEGRYFATILPLVKGEESKGAYMPLRIQPYHG